MLMNETITLRDYQIECLESVSTECRQGISRQLIMLPTGSGKTIIMSAIARQYNKKTLIIAHREELLTQSIDKFKLFWPGVDIGLCKGEYNEIHNQVVVGSVQSCSRPKRLECLKKQGFELLMIDECHHSVSASYKSIINELGFAEGSNRLLIGMTATPMRGDKQGLGDIFDKITYSRSIATMIRAGYLSPVVGRKILTNFSFERIRSRNGDFDLGDLAEAVNTSERNEFIASKFNEYADKRKGVAFCVDVQHCKDLAEAFRRAGINAEAVYGDMPTLERENVLAALKSAKIQIVTSCGILTEGYDEPSIDVVVMARPTKSEGLYIQCVGRGLRIWPGKENCYVLDFTDKGHNLDAVMTLSNTIPEGIHVKEEEEQVERDEIDRTPKINVIESCDRKFDILGSAKFIWVQVGEEWSLQDDEKNEIVMTPSDNGYTAKLYSQDGSSRLIVKTPLPLDYCSGVCEDYARRYLKVNFADASKPWISSNASPSDGQIEYLVKMGIAVSGMTRGQASIEIRKLIAEKNKQRRQFTEVPITPKQKYFLLSHGIDSKNMNKLQAMQEISKIKQIKI